MFAGSSTTLSLQHIAMLCRYIGISFIAGAVSHGAFSNTRSLMTAGIGVVFFVLGQMIEYFTAERFNHNGLIKSLILGTVLAIGLGLFTGGLQHFPDSPDRSLWVVPLGFIMSLVALLWSVEQDTLGHWKSYASAAVVLVGAGSLAAHQYFKAYPDPLAHEQQDINPVALNPQTIVHDSPTLVSTVNHPHAPASNDSSTALTTQFIPSPLPTPEQVVAQAAEREQLEQLVGAELTGQAPLEPTILTSVPPQATVASSSRHLSKIPSFSSAQDHYSAPAIGRYGEAAYVDRVVEITMLDSLRYEPNLIMVRQNETIRFVIHNRGLVKQDWTLGQSAPLRTLAQQLVLEPSTPVNPLLTLAPGHSGELIWQFTEVGNVDFASLQPGQYGAGMVGRVMVMPY
ncbi:MAG: hypothetical protein WAQ53_01815 [Thiofilum sp.]|uniref:cupredoxin domain-containing protein n=1 Tax=Thiofilum sp. TaxID=2212733 RepID=UPI0025D094FC|nr:hypothetical protein [Thiofilum sp.]MBK8451717.1 hypothetical protein [Thiofilum sp.]MBK8455306.1 hypothetical protein [Thiofilum sp.]